MSFHELKSEAKAIMRTAKPNTSVMAGIYILLAYILSMLSSRIMGTNMTVAKMQQYMEHLENGNPEYALALLETMAPTPMGSLISFVLELMLMVVFAGFVIFLLNTIRRSAPSYGNILDGFGMMGRVILLQLLMTIFVFLWSLLLVIPGIIASYRYKMALYLLLDNPQMGVRECLKESGRMMKGHKWNFFLLELSFIGWLLLGSLGVVGYLVQFYSLPYMNLVFCLYYEKLCQPTAYAY